MSIIEDPLGGYCVASHICESTWTIIKGRFETKRDAQNWMNNYRRSERLFA